MEYLHQVFTKEALFSIGKFLFLVLLVANTFRHHDFLKSMIFNFLEWVGIVKKDSVKELPNNLFVLSGKIVFFAFLIYLFVITNTMFFFICFSTLKSFDFLQKKSYEHLFPRLKGTKLGILCENNNVKAIYLVSIFVSLIILFFCFSWSYTALMAIYAFRCYDFLAGFVKDGYVGKKLSQSLKTLELKPVWFIVFYLIINSIMFPAVAFFEYALVVIWSVRGLKTLVFLKGLDMKYVFITQVEESFINTIRPIKLKITQFLVFKIIK